MGYDSADWINLAQNMDQLQSLLNTVMILPLHLAVTWDAEDDSCDSIVKIIAFKYLRLATRNCPKQTLYTPPSPPPKRTSSLRFLSSMDVFCMCRLCQLATVALLTHSAVNRFVHCGEHWRTDASASGGSRERATAHPPLNTPEH